MADETTNDSTDDAPEVEDEPVRKPRSKPSAMDHLRKKKKAVTRTVAIICDSAVADRYASASSRLQEADRELVLRPKDPRAITEREEALEALEGLASEAEEASEDFTFRGIGRKVFEDLIDTHEPTKDQRAKARRAGEEVQWNPDAFPQALVSSSLVSPDLSEGDIIEIWDSEDWNQAELLELFSAALEVNTSRRTSNLGKG